MKNLLLTLLVILGLATATMAQIPKNGLMGWYPFNGNAHDSSGNQLNGTVYGATLTTDRAGKPNSAYLFNGMSYIVINNTSSLDFSKGITFSSWIKPSSRSNASIVDRMPWTDGSSYGFRTSVRSDGQIWTSNGSYGEFEVAFATTDYQVNKWYHVVGTLGSDNTIRTYINGVLINSAVTVHPNNNSVDIEIGKGKGTSINFEVFKGIIDDILVYNRALNSEEVQSVFYGTVTGLYQAEKQNTIKVYPNPATDHTNVEADASMIGSTFSICDQVGRVVQSGILTEENTQINLGNLTKGIYLVRVGDYMKQTFKLVKN